MCSRSFANRMITMNEKSISYYFSLFFVSFAQKCLVFVRFTKKEMKEERMQEKKQKNNSPMEYNLHT